MSGFFKQFFKTTKKLVLPPPVKFDFFLFFDFYDPTANQARKRLSETDMHSNANAEREREK